MLRLPHVVLSMAVVLVYLSAAAAAKQGEGTYTATQSVAGYDGKGELRYTLRLTGNGDAELTCQRMCFVKARRKSSSAPRHCVGVVSPDSWPE